MYKNIVFDLGGVVVGFDPLNYLADRFRDEALESELFRITFASNEWRKMDAGELTREQAEHEMLQAAKKAGHYFEVQAILDDWTSMLRTQHSVVSIIKQLKKSGYNVYFLSNISRDILNLIEQRDFWHLFDGGVASCEILVNKPSPQIYETLLSRYDLKKEETLFTDDNPVNVKAAYDLGITAIQFQGAESLLKSFTAYGVKMKRTAASFRKNKTKKKH